MRRPRKLVTTVTASVAAQAVAIILTLLQPLGEKEIEHCLDAVAAFFGYEVRKVE